MTLHPRDPTAIPEATAALGQQILAPGDPYRVLGDQLTDLLDDTAFADLYAPTGRAALPPALLALVLVFQFLEDLPDRAAARQVAVRLDWKYALHLPLDFPGFDFSVLSYFRQRLRTQAREAQVFAAILAQVEAHGLLRKQGVQRTDSTAVLGAVETLSELELVTETLRLALAALTAAHPLWTAAAIPAALRETYGERQTDYRLTPDERDRRRRLVGEDGAWLLATLAGPGVPAGLADLPAVVTLRTVWAQRYEEQPDGTLGPRPPSATPSAERIATPHDPSVRVGTKRGHSWTGAKVHITESEGPDGMRYITDIDTANAAEADIRALPRIRDRLRLGDRAPATLDVDSGYVSGKALAESAAVGIALIGPPRADTAPHELTRDAFTIDATQRTVICPAGYTARTWVTRTLTDGSPGVEVRFRAADCQACPLRAQCCPTATGGRTVSWSEHTAWLEARRAEAATPAFRLQLRRRAGIEATIAELVRAHGLRRQRYRGARPRHQEHLLTAAACNLKRLLRALAGADAPPDPPAAGAMTRAVAHGGACTGADRPAGRPRCPAW